MEARGSKTLVAAEPMRRPSWLVWTLMKTFRTVMLTVLWSGLGMGAGLFCGIVGLLVAATIQHKRPEMDLAYRLVAIPVAICAGSCALLWNLVRAAQEAVERLKSK
jgi:ABC-type sugar transport system permease subunit